MKRHHQHKGHPGRCHGYCSVFTVSNPESRGDAASTWDYTRVSQQNKTVYTQIFTNAWFPHRFLYCLLRLFIQNLGLLGSAARGVKWSAHHACSRSQHACSRSQHACSRSQHALIMSEASVFLLLCNLICGAFRSQLLFRPVTFSKTVASSFRLFQSEV